MTSQLEEVSLRERAAESFAKLGWPTPRIEEWRYTNLAPLQKIDWRTDDAPRRVESLATMAGRAILELVFVNGKLVEQTGQKFGVPDDVNIADWERNAMVALNTANMQDGARIEIPAGKVVEGFIHFLFIGQGESVWSHPRNIVVAGANSQVTIVETYVGTGTYFTNAVTEIVAHESAVVDHTKLECESIAAYHIGNVYIRQERGANVTSRTFAVGAALARNETHVTLGGEGASITLDGLFLGTGTQHLDNRTVVDHLHPHCESVELYKGVLDQNARGVFDGLIIVRPGAVKTVSRQTNRNLLLSETAIVDSKPNLEIHNNDVKCNHGSTIGQIDEEALFYLRSRGLAEAEARSLLVYAFASEIADRIPIEPVREQVRRALFQAMPERMPERRGGTR
ncbi:MAG TPA: Fe-S cluster assembly protein SufD [Thermoanaerobaculia bacterium]|nr:Fe-S cluster assembly protein SufD [Thermoanaerobaculia bacterium]